MAKKIVYERHDEPDTKCRGCGATVWWKTIPGKKPMIVDADTNEPHWATCPDATRFRKPKK